MGTTMMITDHAVIRWLERNKLVDIEAIRRDIATTLEPAFSAAAKMGANEFTIRRERWKYIFKDGGTLVTCFREEKQQPHRMPRERDFD